MSGRINDRCPGYGYGAYIRFLVYLKGEESGHQFGFDDDRGCDAKALPVSATKTYKKRIVKVQVAVFEFDVHDGIATIGDSTGKLFYPSGRVTNP